MDDESQLVRWNMIDPWSSFYPSRCYPQMTFSKMGFSLSAVLRPGVFVSAVWSPEALFLCIFVGVLNIEWRFSLRSVLSSSVRVLFPLLLFSKVLSIPIYLGLLDSSNHSNCSSMIVGYVSLYCLFFLFWFWCVKRTCLSCTRTSISFFGYEDL